MTTKEHVEEQISKILEIGESDIKVAKKNYNRTRISEADNNCRDIENNYDMGLISRIEMLNRKIDVLTKTREDLFVMPE